MGTTQSTPDTITTTAATTEEAVVEDVYDAEVDPLFHQLKLKISARKASEMKEQHERNK